MQQKKFALLLVLLMVFSFPLFSEEGEVEKEESTEIPPFGYGFIADLNIRSWLSMSFEGKVHILGGILHLQHHMNMYDFGEDPDMIRSIDSDDFYGLMEALDKWYHDPSIRQAYRLEGRDILDSPLAEIVLTLLRSRSDLMKGKR